MKTIRLLIILCLIGVLNFTVEAQKKKKKNSKDAASVPVKKKEKSDFKKYSEVITKKAISDDGLLHIQ